MAEIIPCEPDTDNTDEGSFHYYRAVVLPHSIGVDSIRIDIFYLRGMTRKLTSILTIAGSDSSAGAGIQADLKSAGLCNVYATTAITAITAQSTSKVIAAVPVNPELLSQQLEAIISDGMPDAIKIGMLGSIENARIVKRYLANVFYDIPIVVDPVISATCGGQLTTNRKRITDLYMQHIFPLSTVVTPNIDEAYELTSSERGSLSGDEQIALASEIILKSGCRSAVVKGGHSNSDFARDILMENNSGEMNTTAYESKKFRCDNLHGTGCSYSTFLASGLALGYSVKDAFVFASKTTKTLIGQSCGYEFGNAGNGSLNHFNYKIK